MKSGGKAIEGNLKDLIFKKGNKEKGQRSPVQDAREGTTPYSGLNGWKGWVEVAN